MMRWKAYPWPVSRKPRKNSAVGDAARNSGGIDAWDYPEDVRQHPRSPKIGRVALGLSIAAVVALWTGVALSDANRAAFASSEPTHDAHGRLIVNGSGGGTIQWGYRQAEGYWHEGQPIRLSGRFTSAGTFLLWSVENLPGSCIEADASFGFHRPQEAAALVTFCAPVSEASPRYAGAMEAITRPLNAATTGWFYQNAPACGFANLSGADLAGLGYPMCEEEQ